MGQIFYIGGSPCSGKSTVAEIIAKKNKLYYFKVDENLERYIGEAAAIGLPACTAVQKMTPDEIWMREPSVQNEEELMIYQEIFPFVQRDLLGASEEGDVITEGAAYLPMLMKQAGIPNNRYVSLTPTKDFQISHYKQREWIHFVLDQCSNGEQAFHNWMERDCLFAKDVQMQCEKYEYQSFVNDGSVSVDDYVHMILDLFPNNPC